MLKFTLSNKDVVTIDADSKLEFEFESSIQEEHVVYKFKTTNFSDFREIYDFSKNAQQINSVESIQILYDTVDISIDVDDIFDMRCVVKVGTESEFEFFIQA